MAIAAGNRQFDNIAAVIFDKDGTLENSLAFWRAVGLERARAIDALIPGVGEPLTMAFGITNDTIDSQGLLAVGSRRENEIAAAAYIAETGKSWYEARQIARSIFAEVSASKYLVKTAKSSPIFADARQTLESLFNTRLKIGILSADSTAGVQNFVANHQLQNLIHLCLGVDNAIAKPDPQLFIKACADLGVLPEQTLMVGDTSVDMVMAKTAKAAGTIGICREQNILLESADVQIGSLLEIQVL